MQLIIHYDAVLIYFSSLILLSYPVNNLLKISKMLMKIQYHRECGRVPCSFHMDRQPRQPNPQARF